MRKVILLLAFVSSGAIAETPRLVPDSQVNHYGIGANRCAQFLDDPKQDGDSSGVRGAFYAAWFKGHVSGFNQFASKQVEVALEPSRVLTYFDKWCRAIHREMLWALLHVSQKPVAAHRSTSAASHNHIVDLSTSRHRVFYRDAEDARN